MAPLHRCHRWISWATMIPCRLTQRWVHPARVDWIPWAVLYEGKDPREEGADKHGMSASVSSGLYKAKNRLSRTFSFSPISSKNRLKKMLTSNSSLLHLNEKDNHNFNSMKRLSVPSRQVRDEQRRWSIEHRLCLFRTRSRANETFLNHRRDSCTPFKNISTRRVTSIERSCFILSGLLTWSLFCLLAFSCFSLLCISMWILLSQSMYSLYKHNKSIDPQTRIASASTNVNRVDSATEDQRIELTQVRDNRRIPAYSIEQIRAIRLECYLQTLPNWN